MSNRVNARAVKKVNGWLTWFWVFNFPPVLFVYATVDDAKFQRIMLLYLALVSIWANVAGHFAAWVSGRVDVMMEEKEDA